MDKTNGHGIRQHCTRQQNNQYNRNNTVLFLDHDAIKNTAPERKSHIQILLWIIDNKNLTQKGLESQLVET